MTINRREFFRRASLIAAGIVAADQLEILERLTHRKVFALGGLPVSPARYARLRYASIGGIMSGESTTIEVSSNMVEWRAATPADGRLPVLGHPLGIRAGVIGR